MVFRSRSTAKFFGICIPPRKPPLHLQMSKSKNLCRRAKIILVGTIGTMHKTNLPGQFIGQVRDILRSTSRIAKIGKFCPSAAHRPIDFLCSSCPSCPSVQNPHRPGRKNQHLAKPSRVRLTPATVQTSATNFDPKIVHPQGRPANRTNGINVLQLGRRLVSPDGLSIRPPSGPPMVSAEARAFIR